MPSAHKPKDAWNKCNTVYFNAQISVISVPFPHHSVYTCYTGFWPCNKLSIVTCTRVKWNRLSGLVRHSFIFCDTLQNYVHVAERLIDCESKSRIAHNSNRFRLNFAINVLLTTDQNSYASRQKTLERFASNIIIFIILVPLAHLQDRAMLRVCVANEITERTVHVFCRRRVQ